MWQEGEWLLSGLGTAYWSLWDNNEQIKSVQDDPLRFSADQNFIIAFANLVNVDLT